MAPWGKLKRPGATIGSASNSPDPYTSQLIIIPSGPTKVTCEVEPTVGGGGLPMVITPGPGPSTPGPGCMIRSAGGRLLENGSWQPVAAIKRPNRAHRY